MAESSNNQAEVLIEQLLPAVRQVMSIQDVSTGGAREGYVVRYRGRLILDSEEAFGRLEPIFRDQGVSLIFRMDGEDHVVLALPGVIEPTPSNPWINVLLFILTLGSMLLAGVYYGYEGPVGDFFSTLLNMLRELPRGIPFAVSLLSILLAHEFGHYLAARYHKNPVSLPYFIPFPPFLGGLFGTLGAFIRLKEPPRNRKTLLDIGLAGPLAGLAVAIPVLILGLSLSEVSTLPEGPITGQISVLEGNSILYLGAKYLVKSELLPAPVDYGQAGPGLYWIRYFFLGQPLPYGGKDVLMHPIAWAGWVGLLVTALNLIPAGQLDGGHTIYVLLGRSALRLWPFIIVALVMMGMAWSGWFLWAFLIFMMGRTYARPKDEITPLDPRRRVIAIFGLIVFILVFTPVPLRLF